MNIADIIPADRIRICSDVTSKKRSLEEVSQTLALGTPYLTEKEILNSLIARERLGSTGMGEGIAIPHGRMNGLEESVGAFVKLDEGIDYEANDGKPVDLLFGLVVPQDADESHLEILAMLAEISLEEDFCSKVREAESPEAIQTLLIEYESHTRD